MKLTEYLLFAALLTPTIVVVAAAYISLAGREPAPEYHPPVAMTTSNGIYPIGMTTDE
jgi:hypothetical protein